MCFARCIIVIIVIAGKIEGLVQGLDFARILCVHAPNATSNGGDASRVGIEKVGKYELY